MAWERPVGFDDPMDSWENEALAYDGDAGTVATSVPLPAEVWTGWLNFDFKPFIAQRFVCRVNCPAASYSFNIYAWNGTAWTQWINVIHTAGPYSPSLRLTPYAYSRVRIRFQHHGAGWQRGELNDVRIDRICGGPLVAICGVFGQAAEWLSDTADDIEDVMFVGDTLAAPFRALADIFTTAQTTCCTASAALQQLLDTIQAGITPEFLLNLIQEHWPTLYELITDPVGWFLVQLTLAFDLEPWHTQSLEFLAKWVLEEYFPTLYLVWLDPDAWVEEHISPLIPELPDWLADPDGWLRDAVERLFPTLTEFLADPDAWLRERVLDIIREFTEDIAAFLDNAWGWLLDQYEAAFESIQARLYYLAEHTLRFFWEGEW